jgi:hypothetical protein
VAKRVAEALEVRKGISMLVEVEDGELQPCNAGICAELMTDWLSWIRDHRPTSVYSGILESIFSPTTSR